MARKVGRPNAEQSNLSKEKILEAALNLVDLQGVEAMSMRRLAAALNVDPMAIYHYLPNKEAVLRGMVELIFATLQVSTLENATWEDQVRACVHAYYKVVRKHPQLIVYIVGDLDLVMQAALNANNEQLYAALFRAGLNAHQVFHAASLIIDYLHGYLLAENVIQAHDQATMIQHMEQFVTAEYPYLQRILAEIQTESMPQTFGYEMGLNIILAGIKASV